LIPPPPGFATPHEQQSLPPVHVVPSTHHKSIDDDYVASQASLSHQQDTIGSVKQQQPSSTYLSGALSVATSTRNAESQTSIMDQPPSPSNHYPQENLSDEAAAPSDLVENRLKSLIVSSNRVAIVSTSPRYPRSQSRNIIITQPQSRKTVFTGSLTSKSRCEVSTLNRV
jgi:hypothetical protein